MLFKILNDVIVCILFNLDNKILNYVIVCILLNLKNKILIIKWTQCKGLKIQKKIMFPLF